MDENTLKAVGLLLVSNLFMTAAWYGHLRFKKAPLVVAIFASWGIALAEYVFQVPANRVGSRTLSTYQLKIIQEAITLVMFVGFSWFWLGEKPTLRSGIAFALILAAVVVGYKR
jgi:uncharacterized protein (DUF486 family)